MNIAIFSDSYYPTKSGVVTVVVQLKKILELHGHHVVVVTVSDKRKHSYTEDDPNVFRVHSLESPLGDNQFVGFPRKKKIIEFLKEHKIEIIHAHTEFSMGQTAILAGKALKIPVIATTHTMWEDYYRYYLSLGVLIPRKVIRSLVKKLYKRFFALINVSQKARDYFNEPFMLPKTPCAIVPNAIDSEKFIGQTVTESDKAKLRKSLGIKKTDRVVLYVGRVVEEKRVVELLDIMMRVVRARSNVKMVFVGSGAALDILKETVIEEKLEKSIIFTGFIDWKKVYSYYSIGDMFITTSLSEMHSMTILEAMSMGLPIVCRRDTSFSDTVFHGKDGFIADSDEEVDAYLYDLIDNPEMAKKMGEVSREISRGFSLELHGRRTEAFYKKILSEYPKKPSSASLQDAVSSVK